MITLNKCYIFFPITYVTEFLPPLVSDVCANQTTSAMTKQQRGELLQLVLLDLLKVVNAKQEINLTHPR